MTKPEWKFEDLIHLWNSLEPEQCKHIGGNTYALRIDGSPLEGDIWRFDVTEERMKRVTLALILDRVLHLAEVRNARISLENHKDGWLATIGRLNGELKVLHANRGRGEQTIAALEAYVGFLGWENARQEVPHGN